MNTCTATIIPPVEGTVTVTMPESTARKLRAMLKACNGDVFADLEGALADLGMIPMTLVGVKKAKPTEAWNNGEHIFVTINLFDGLVFKEGDYE